jgi:hypothetical protein
MTRAAKNKAANAYVKAAPARLARNVYDPVFVLLRGRA